MDSFRSLFGVQVEPSSLKFGRLEVFGISEFGVWGLYLELHVLFPARLVKRVVFPDKRNSGRSKVRRTKASESQNKAECDWAGCLWVSFPAL